MPGIARTLSRARSAPPLPLLAGLVAIQLGVALVVALTATHNHFVWYSGGDATEYWTASWSLAHGEIGQSIVGYGIPVLWAWVPLVTGTTLVGGLPVIVLLQAIVLIPLALVLFWAVADRLFGRAFAWWAAVLWIVTPLLMLAAFSPTYAPQFHDLFLAPFWFGLTDMADMPSVVAALATVWATLRLYERRTVEDGVLAGLLAGVLIALKPANGFLLPALVVLLVGVRQARPLAAFALGLVPGLVTLALWKARGLGHLPIVSAVAPQARVADGPRPVIAVATHRYLQFDWTHLHAELNDLGGVFWSVRMLEFVVVAGALAAIRRAPLKGVFVVVWFAAFCLVKGSSHVSEIRAVSYWRFVDPGLPALILLAGALVYLVPRRGRPFDEPERAARLAGGRRTVVVTAVVAGGLPLALMLLAHPARVPHYVRIDALANDAPLSNELAVSASSNGRLDWRRVDTAPTASYYVVYRSATGDGCTVPPEGAKECQLAMDPVGTTRSTSFVDRPGRGPHWYRVALMSNFRDATDGSDLMLIGPATAVAASR